jgi:hypothetical protein
MAKYCHSEEVFQKKIDGSVCLLKSKDRYVYKLNETASFLWELLNKKGSRKELSKALIKKYKIPESQAQKDVEDFLKYYLSENLIKKVSD